HGRKAKGMVGLFVQDVHAESLLRVARVVRRLEPEARTGEPLQKRLYLLDQGRLAFRSRGRGTQVRHESRNAVAAHPSSETAAAKPRRRHCRAKVKSRPCPRCKRPAARSTTSGWGRRSPARRFWFSFTKVSARSASGATSRR